MPATTENIQLVQRLPLDKVDLVHYFGEGAPPIPAEAVAAFAPDVEVEFMPATLGESPHYRGVKGLVKGWREWLGPWESYWIEGEEWLDAGDEVVGLARVRARTKRDGVVVEHAPAAVWTIKDGKIVRVRFYLDRAEAFEAAGLDRTAASGRRLPD